MKRDVRIQWQRALLSGQYHQGQHFLRSARGFCCLGVLCDLASHDQPGIRWRPDAPNPPTQVLDWAGVPDQHRVDFMEFFCHLNDTLEWSFEKIAGVLMSDDIYSSTLFKTWRKKVGA